MPYESQISRTQPTAFLFLVDQSYSMTDKMSTGKSKADFVADVLNKTITELVAKCSKSEGVRDYFEIGIIGYGHETVANALQGELAGNVINPISLLEQNPIKVEERKKKMDDGAGGIIELAVKFPIWYNARANGGTPMRAALTMAAEELVEWCDRYPESYPPTVLHITDGESTDGNPEEIAEKLKQISTIDGDVLVFNLHVSTSGEEPISFPAGEMSLNDEYSKMLFRMSSLLPAGLTSYAQEKGYKVSGESRGFILNAEASDIVDFFDIGTRAAQLR